MLSFDVSPHATYVRDMNHDLHYQSIQSISEKIKTRELSPVTLVEECLRRIAELNPNLNAFITITADEARQQAKDLEKEIRDGKWRGPLHGVPIAVKDFYDTSHIRTTAGSEHLAKRIPRKDAISVKKLKDAGAIILGKTNMDAFGMATTGLTSAFGPVHNPWDKDYVTGGSSAGSAAAVASGMCYATLDTDAVGSTRLPASCCGVVGFKPSYGQINLEGVLDGEQKPDEFIIAMGHGGIVTRDVVDTAIVYDALTDNTMTSHLDESPVKLRIGIGNGINPSPQVRKAVDEAVKKIRQFTAVTVDAEIPSGDPAAGLTNIKEDRKTVDQKYFTDVDVILLPTIMEVVPTIKNAMSDPEEAVSAEFTAFANYFGLPALSIPCGFDGNGMPIGLQIVGKPGDEGSVLKTALYFQNIHNLEHPNL